MRIGFVVMLGLVAALIGGTCVPLIPSSSREPQAGDSLGIVVLMPDADRTIAEGVTVAINWAASSVTDDPATVTISVESRVDLTRTVLLDSQPLTGTGGSGSVSWNTEGYAGLYVIYGAITAGGKTVEASAVGRITVQARPKFEFTEPTEDTEYQLGSTATLTIEWTASGTGATASVRLDRDTDPNNGNEFVIAEPELPETSESDSIQWAGKDTGGSDVSTGTYNLQAVVNDGVNPQVIANGFGQITVLEAEPNAPTSPEITAPTDDVTFLTTDPNALTIKYAVNQSSDALVDIKLDPDDNRTDGNEITILSQQFVKGGEDPNSFAWTGSEASDPNVQVLPGIYRIFLAVNTGTSSVQTTDGEGFVFRRSDEKQPLIALLSPTSVTNVVAGNNVFIQWRDDSDPNSNAKIRLVVAGTRVAADHVSDPNALQILVDRPANDDGVWDTYNWSVPSSSVPPLALKTQYYIIAYIENEDGVLKSSSVAAGSVIITDPTQP